MCNQRDEDNVIQDIDFFKVTFWGEPIPPKKIDRIIGMNEEQRN